MNMEFKRKLPTLHEIKDMYPISEESAQTKKRTDEELEKIFSGKTFRRTETENRHSRRFGYAAGVYNFG